MWSALYLVLLEWNLSSAHYKGVDLPTKIHDTRKGTPTSVFTNDFIRRMKGGVYGLHTLVLVASWAMTRLGVLT